MVFSSVSFLFFFLPTLIIVYKLVPKKWRNGVLLLFSMFFYFFGERWYLILLLGSCYFNYKIGCTIGKKRKRKVRKKLIIIGLLVNIGLLFYFKYTNFFLGMFANIFGFNKITLKIALPLGISFFTFQNISYLLDVYKRRVEYEQNLFIYMTYITLFPQLVAGPIVRYKDVKEQLVAREECAELMASGIKRFVLGLGKKVLIADVLYGMYTEIMASSMSILSYWLVAIMITFQIYYDFSGYSDMAIGLGKMFGFEFLENFNYPLISKSISEFWRRWHISLSSFFKDYIYIPLGGSKRGLLKNILNIAVVWILTGLWHGANWNFVLWGIYFFVFLCLEKFIIKNKFASSRFKYLYTAIVIIISFVIFSIEDLTELSTFIKGMFGGGIYFIDAETIYYLKSSAIVILISMIGMGPWLANLKNKLTKGKLVSVVGYGELIFTFVILLLAIAGIVSNSFNPFIYFRF